MEYKIYFTSAPSNLGRGKVYYFVCPISNKRARILYKCYGSLYWKHREAYNNRIYYDSQLYSKKYYTNGRFWDLTHDLEELNKRIVKTHYKGKETHLIKRRNKLIKRKDIYDFDRLIGFAHRINLI
jgi:hypothetical protein